MREGGRVPARAFAGGRFAFIRRPRLTRFLPSCLQLTLFLDCCSHTRSPARHASRIPAGRPSRVRAAPQRPARLALPAPRRVQEPAAAQGAPRGRVGAAREGGAGCEEGGGGKRSRCLKVPEGDARGVQLAAWPLLAAVCTVRATQSLCVTQWKRALRTEPVCVHGPAARATLCLEGEGERPEMRAFETRASVAREGAAIASRPDKHVAAVGKERGAPHSAASRSLSSPVPRFSPARSPHDEGLTTRPRASMASRSPRASAPSSPFLSDDEMALLASPNTPSGADSRASFTDGRAGYAGALSSLPGARKLAPRPSPRGSGCALPPPRLLLPLVVALALVASVLLLTQGARNTLAQYLPAPATSEQPHRLRDAFFDAPPWPLDARGFGILDAAEDEHTVTAIVVHGLGDKGDGLPWTAALADRFPFVRWYARSLPTSLPAQSPN